MEHAMSGLKKVRPQTIAVNLNNSATGTSSYYSPWRYLLFADNLPEYYNSKYIIYTLNIQDTAGLHNLLPGKAFRDMRLTTASAIECIDFAAKMKYQYVLFDAGWYGMGYRNESNVKSNPFVVVDSIDMPLVLNHAKSKGIDMMLYINNVALQNYNMDSAFNLYRSWGVKALKFGFVNGLNQTGRKFTLNMVKKAANYGFGVVIHDNLRPSGTEQTYINHLSTEGVRGNEYVTNTAAHTTILPFSRFMIGAADYTFCYKDPSNSTLPTMPVTKGHQLAISVAFFSPIQSVMWYGKPGDYSDSVEVEFFKYLPVYWNDSKVLDGAIGKFVTVARKYNSQWFWSSYSQDTRVVRQNCAFLGNDSLYKRTCYFDSAGTISKKIDTVSRFVINYYSLQDNGGCACMFEKIDSVAPSPIVNFLASKDTVSMNDSLVYFVIPKNISNVKSFKIYASVNNTSVKIEKGRYVDDKKVTIETDGSHIIISYDSDLPITCSDTLFSLSFIVNSNNSGLFVVDSVLFDEVNINKAQTFPSIIQSLHNSFSCKEFTIFPTYVTAGFVYLFFPVHGKLHLSVLDISGQKVLSKTVHVNYGETITLDVAYLRKGMYFLKVDSFTGAKKFIVH